MMPPEQYCEFIDCALFDYPTLLHKGPIDENFKQQVREGKLSGMTFEGVVCKTKPDRKWGKPVMYKIKNQAWIDKVKANYKPSLWKELL
jgi:hypothetical protein